jgi:hypothetical protein
MGDQYGDKQHHRSRIAQWANVTDALKTAPDQLSESYAHRHAGDQSNQPQSTLDANFDAFTFCFNRRHSRRRGLHLLRLIEHEVVTLPTGHGFLTLTGSQKTAARWGRSTEAVTPFAAYTRRMSMSRFRPVAQAYLISIGIWSALSLLTGWNYVIFDQSRNIHSTIPEMVLLAEGRGLAYVLLSPAIFISSTAMPVRPGNRGALWRHTALA